MSGLADVARLNGSPFGRSVFQYFNPKSIRSIQSGSIVITGAVSATATLTAVVPENCLIFLAGTISAAVVASDQRSHFGLLTLTNGTTLTATRQFDAGFQTALGWYVIEFYPGILKTVARGTVAMNSVASNTATIPAVTVAKAFPTPSQGQTTTDNTTTWDANLYSHQVVLTNATTVTVTRNTAGAVLYTVGYQIPEFYN